MRMRKMGIIRKMMRSCNSWMMKEGVEEGGWK